MTVKNDLQQLRALMLKQLTLQTRQKKTLCCQLLTPIVLLTLGTVFMYGMIALLKSVLPDGAMKVLNPPEVDFFHDGVLPFFDGKISPRGWVAPKVLLPDTLLVSASHDVNLQELGQLSYLGGAGNTGFLGRFEQGRDIKSNRSSGSSTGALFVPYSRSMLDPSMEQFNQSISAYLGSEMKQGRELPWLLGGYTLRALNAQQRVLQIDIHHDRNCVNLLNLGSYIQSGMMSPLGGYWDVYCKKASRSMLLQLVFNAAVKYFLPAMTDFSLQTALAQMPFENNLFEAAFSQFKSVVAMPISIALCLPLPMLIFTILLERSSGLRETMRLNGMKLRNYWFVTIGFNSILYMYTILVVLVFSYAALYDYAIYSNFFPIIAFYICCCVYIQSLAFLMSCLFKSQLFALFVSYGMALAVPYFANSFNVVLFLKFEAFDPLYLLLFIPLNPINFTLNMGLMYPCNVASRCAGFLDLFRWNHLTVGLTFLLLNSVIYIICGWYLDSMSSDGSVFFFAKPLVRLLKRSAKGKNRSRAYIPETTEEIETKTLLDDVHNEMLESHVITMSSLSGASTVEDEDVAEERRKAQLLEKPENDTERSSFPSVVINHLTKNFGSKTAVDDISLVINKGESFGFCGPNGAGKTTTLNCLAGMLRPSQGDCLIGGYSIRSELGEARKKLGFCPQFEVTWPDLTVREHLLFYARLKGVARSEEKAHIDAIIEQVGLAGLGGNARAGRLSGGMRKRLGIAMALVGNPEIVFMDEMTTGLDPVTKRQIHGVLLEAKKHVTLIITSHALEEMEILCDRLCVIGSGKIKCIGSPMHLKSKFGRGYRVSINFHEQHRATAEAFIRQLVPSATILATFAGQTTFNFPAVKSSSSKGSGSSGISSIFANIEQHKDESKILEYTISQTTLEDVYMHITAE